MPSFFVTKASDLIRVHVALDKHELPFRIKVSKGGKRSLEQNAYLWGVCYETILAHGLRDDGWHNEDLHEYFLGEFHGWETIEGFGQKRKKPVRRSSGKSISEFMDYIEFIHQKAAEMGVYIPDPNET